MLVTIFLVEFIGRKKTFSLLFTSSGIGFCLLFICFPYEHTLKTVLLFIIRGTNAGAFNLAFLYTGEVYNTTIRARSISILSTFSRIATILTGFVSQFCLENISYRHWIIRGCGASDRSSEHCSALRNEGEEDRLIVNYLLLIIVQVLLYIICTY